MAEPTDHELLARFVRTGDQAAFAALAARHVNLVYSAARRFANDDILAQEITQAVFIILARKAGKISSRAVITGWLYQTARLTAANALKEKIRRQKREQEACMQSTLDTPDANDAWKQLAPLLDEAVNALRTADRDAVLLRYFENKPLAEVGAALGVSEDAARVRVNRALDKLRLSLAKKGVTLGATVIAGVLLENSVKAAPAELVKGISTTKGPAAGALTLMLVKETLKMPARAQFKYFISAGVLTAVTGGILITTTLLNQPHEPEKLPVKPPEEEREVMTDTAFIELDSPPGGLSVQADGKIIAAASLFGRFIDPQSGNLGYFERGAIRLNADGSLDRSFSCAMKFPGSDSARAHVDSLPEGKIFLSGLFDSVDGQPRPGYARLLPDGRVDETFVPNSPTGNSNAPALGRTYLPGGTYPAAALNDGSIAVMTANPLTVYRLDATGELIAAATNVSPLFPPHAGLVFTLKNEGFWGNWSGQLPVDWNRTTPAKRRPMVHPNEQLPFEDCAEQPSATDAAEVFKALFAEVPMELCRVATRLPEGGAVLAVQDRFINGSLVAPGHLMRFNGEWRPDFSFTNQYEFDRRGSMTIRRLADGKFLAAGGFVKMNGADFPGLVRLNENGEIDSGFHCEVTGENAARLVMDVAVQADGKILICGAFTQVDGQKRQHLARLNPDGSLDDSFKNLFIGSEELQAHRRFPVYHLATPPVVAATNAIAAISEPETILIISVDYRNGVATIQFTGGSQKSYILQAKNSLTASDWINVSTNQISGNGRGIFSDGEAGKYPTRFYRIASPK